MDSCKDASDYKVTAGFIIINHFYSAVPLALTDPGKMISNWWNLGKIYNKILS